MSVDAIFKRNKFRKKRVIVSFNNQSNFMTISLPYPLGKRDFFHGYFGASCHLLLTCFDDS